MNLLKIKLENIFLNIFNFSVMIIMLFALLAIVLLLTMSSIEFLKKPSQVSPPKIAILKDINVSDFKDFLIENEKLTAYKNLPKKNISENYDLLSTYQPYKKDVLDIYRCSEKFAKNIGVMVESKESKVVEEEIEKLRNQILLQASSVKRGDQWVRSLVIFICTSVNDSAIITLKKEEKIGQVIQPAIEYHIKNWDKNINNKYYADRKEEERVQRERQAEIVRIENAKYDAKRFLIGAVISLGIFMFFALYLLLVRIERSIRNISQSISQ